MKWSLLIVVFASSAFADELPWDLCLTGQNAGDACKTDDGAKGSCVAQTIKRTWNGVSHSTTHLICVAPATATQRVVGPWFGAGLAFLALCAALATRRGGRVQSVA